MNKHNTAKIRFIGFTDKAGEQRARIQLFPKYCSGLKGLKAYSHCIILYWLHLRDNRKDRATLLVFPKRHKTKAETGVFACRSPSRPNPIGLCVAELLGTETCALTVKGFDARAGSPIIDVKPYAPRADSIPNARAPDWAANGPAT